MRSAISAAFNGFYYNSLRLVPVNVVWGGMLLLIGGFLFVLPAISLVLFLVLLPLATGGLFRLAAMIQRGEPTTLRDAFAWRSFGRRAVVAGALVGGSTLILSFNLALGLASGNPIGWAFATTAFWGLVIVLVVASATWPLLLDPLRSNEPVMALVRLALTVIFVRPLRYLGLAVLLAVVLVVSTILFAAVVTVSIAFVCLALTNYVIPAADRIEGRRTFVVIS